MRFGKNKVSEANQADEPNADSSGRKSSGQIPVASVQPARVGVRDIFTGSYMWLVALACFAVAIGVAWWSMPQQGIDISIHFPDGHGLESEDAVRFRGIDVGTVEEVRLNRDLTGVDVAVKLRPFAQDLAREGTRFWVVRPELSLGGGVSGLETAVGHKYIGLIPGDADGQWESRFDGLSAAPPDAMENSGIEIVLRGEKRYGVTAGSPVSYRGVVVGRILSVGLSQDGRFADVRARIFDKYTKLATSKTKFWAISGLDIRGSLTKGVNVELESLETLARGGVAMLTIENGGLPIKPGDDFVLHSSAGKDWFEKAQSVQVTDTKYRRGALPMETFYIQDGFLGDSEKRVGFVGVHISTGGQQRVLIPSDTLKLPSKGVEGSLSVGLAGAGESSRITSAASETALTIIELAAADASSLSSPLTNDDFRAPLQRENCLAIRANQANESKQLTYIHYPIEQSEISEDWKLSSFSGDRNVWHGAPVLSERDGRLIGILMVEPNSARVEMLPDSLGK